MSVLFVSTGPSAFKEWIYDVKYTPVSPSRGATLTTNTSSLNASIINLQPGTLYQLNVVATGPGGQHPLIKPLVFITKSEGAVFSTVQLCNCICSSVYFSPCIVRELS